MTVFGVLAVLGVVLPVGSLTVFGVLAVLGVILLVGSLIYGLVARPSRRAAADQSRIQEAERQRADNPPRRPH
jgi:hypothetical protein